MSESRWLVQGVFDPDSGVDFAYTVGLFPFAGVELHLWCQPTFGDDPGAGFRFSQPDMARILNGRAAAIVDDGVDPASEFEMAFDAGLSHARFVPRRVRASQVDAFAVGDVPVVTLDWELHRRFVLVDDTRAERALRTLTKVVPQPVSESGNDERLGVLPSRWAVTLESLDAGQVNELLELSAPSAGLISAGLGVVAAVARATGRDDRLQQARTRASKIVDVFSERVDPSGSVGSTALAFSVAAPVTGAVVADVLDQVGLLDWTAEDLQNLMFGPARVVVDPLDAHARAVADQRVQVALGQVLANPARVLTRVVGVVSDDPDVVGETVRAKSLAAVRAAANVNARLLGSLLNVPDAASPVLQLLAAAMSGVLVDRSDVLNRFGVQV